MNAAMEALRGKIIPVLDDGHISLVDYMGDDLAVVDAARVSFFGHSSKHTDAQNRSLLRYLMRGRHCYDDQTEVLTSDGFVPWPDVKEGMKLGIWDPAANTLCYEEPEYLTRDPYKGDMYRVDHGGVDLLVTPEHSMWVRLKDQWDASSKSQGWSGYRLIPANELGDRSCIRYSKLAPMVAPTWTGEGFPPCNDPQALLELIGFFIGDGSARGSRANGIDFHLKKKREIEFLHDCVALVGWTMREFPSYGGKRTFCVYAEGIGHQFQEMFYWNDNKKHLPDWCLRLDRDDAAAVLNGMRHSDGSEKRGAWVYYTGSCRLAEQVQILGLHAGEACHISHTDQPEPYDPMYRVMFMSRMREPVVNQGKVQTSMEPYDGMVYCAKTRTGILVVRRNGKIVLSGNTTPFEMCEIKLRVRVPMDAWRQWIRHRTACLAEGTEVYFDLPGGIKRRGNQLHKIKIEDLWERFQPTQNTSNPRNQKNPHFKRDRVRQMRVRQVNENTLAIQRTRVVDVFKNGIKPVFRITLTDGKTIEATADHQFIFADGWSTLKKTTGVVECNGRAVYAQGDYYLHVNGATAEVPASYQDPNWLNTRYNVDNARIADIATECGVSYACIRKWIKVHGIQQPKGGRSQEPWNKDKTYILGPREPSNKWIKANQCSRAGEASNFWKGGVSSDRDLIGRWTTTQAAHVHRKNGWTCQLCHRRANELHCHHIVPVWADESLARDKNNLTTLCGDCHRDIHGKELDYVEQLGGPPVKTEWVKKPRIPWNKLTVAKLVRIEKIEFAGHKMTYDIEVEGPFHNFIANGIVTHNSVNESSTRYAPAIDSAQRVTEWRAQSTDNKQGSAGTVTEWPDGFRMMGIESTPAGDLPVTPAEYLSFREGQAQSLAREVYEERLAFGVAKEQARKDLPLSTYTEAYWKMDLHNLLHFLSLRLDPHAQQEIREFAWAIADIVKVWVPWTWEAFEDYRLEAMYLIKAEVRAVHAVLSRLIAEGYKADSLIRGAVQAAGVTGREKKELEAKLDRLLSPSE